MATKWPHVKVLELQGQNSLFAWQTDALEGGTDPQLTVSQQETNFR